MFRVLVCSFSLRHLQLRRPPFGRAAAWRLGLGRHVKREFLRPPLKGGATAQRQYLLGCDILFEKKHKAPYGVVR